VKGNIFYIVVALFVVSVIITINLFFQQNYQAEMVEQFNKQQILLAETTAKNIEDAVSHIKDKAEMLSGLLAGRLRSPDIKEIVERAIKDVRGDLKELTIFDSKGYVVYSTEDNIHMPQLSIPRGILVSEDIGEKVIKIVSPIEDSSGLIEFVIDIDALNRKFVEPIKAGSKGYAWMMDSTGTLLFHPTQPAMEGKNLFKADASCFNCHKSFEAERRILEGRGVGVQSYIAPFGEDKILAFSRARLSDDILWIAVVSMPYSEVTSSMRKSARLHSILIISIFGATGASAFTLIALNRKRIKAEERARHEAELQAYANELERMVAAKTHELRTEKEKLDAIVEALGVGLFIADHTKKIIWMNKTLSDWFGGERELTIEDIYGKDASLEMSSISDKMVREVVYHTLGRRSGYYQITITPLEGPENRMQVLGVVHDVTEIKKFEESMAHSEKLASLGRLTAGIAHEIGNPLTSVFSFLQILREMETDDFKKESLDTILFHINRIADIVRQLSGLAKVPPAEYKETSINELIESSLSLLQYDKRAKSITVRKELGSIPNIITDKNQLSQVFVNMILNAVDAMPDGGTLTIRSLAKNSDIEVEFEDTGIGISKENMARVFDPFFTTKDKGTGLGLSVSYSIMKRLGGDISVESEEGVGTKFKIRIPMRNVDDKTA